jgi:hypothetical protein
MPQLVNHKITVQVDKGPKIESEGKLEASSYSAWIEEEVCRCGELFIDMGPAPTGEICLLVIAADKYSNDKDVCPPTNGNGSTKASRNCLQYAFVATEAEGKSLKSNSCANFTHLSSPHVLTAPYVKTAIGGKYGLYVCNPLSVNVKVSVLMTRQPTCACPAPVLVPAGA